MSIGLDTHCTNTCVYWYNYLRAGQFDGPKNYEYFEGLVKQKYIFD